MIRDIGKYRTLVTDAKTHCRPRVYHITRFNGKRTNAECTVVDLVEVQLTGEVPEIDREKGGEKNIAPGGPAGSGYCWQVPRCALRWMD